MRNIWTMARKELSSYFRSPIAYIVLGGFAVTFAYFFYFESLVPFMMATFSAPQYAQMTGQMPHLNVNEMVIRPLMYLIGIVCLFLVPMITMRLFAEEKKTGTIELLMTSPLTDLQIVLGKFLAALLLYAAMLGLTALYMLVFILFGNPDWRPMLTGYVGLFLLGGCYLSLGMFLSTFTRNQLVAGSLTFLLLLLLWVVGSSSAYSPSIGGQVANYLSLTNHMENFSKGVLDLKDTVYYLSVIGVSLFLTLRSLESVRWRA
jgi:ABC-2 type transport system permease protein